MNRSAPVTFHPAKPKGIANGTTPGVDLSKPTPPPEVPSRKVSAKVSHEPGTPAFDEEMVAKRRPPAPPRKQRRSALDIVDAVTVLLSQVPRRQRAQILDIVKRTLA